VPTPERYTANMSKRLLQGQELEQRARELGVDIEGSSRAGSLSGTRPRAEDHELQQRVIEAERANRESRLWLLALTSAVASIVSALAAWAAILRK
jgi:sugar diacid utilization regulator